MKTKRKEFAVRTADGGYVLNGAGEVKTWGAREDADAAASGQAGREVVEIGVTLEVPYTPYVEFVEGYVARTNGGVVKRDNRQAWRPELYADPSELNANHTALKVRVTIEELV